MIAKHLRSLITFYRHHFFVGFTISLSCMWMYSALGNSVLAILCWFKSITMGIFFCAINHRKKREFYYYQNIGISRTELWLVTFSVDLLLFSLLMSATNPPK